VTINVSIIVRTMLVCVSVGIICGILARLLHWRRLAPGQRIHWSSLLVLVAIAGMSSVKALTHTDRVGWVAVVVLLGMCGLLVSILSPLFPLEPEKEIPMSTNTVTADPSQKGWWTRFTTLEPAVWRGLITAIVAIAAIWGADIADLGKKVTDTLDIIGGIVLLLGPFWIRQGVTPASQVIAKVDATGAVVAGDAAAAVPTGAVLSPAATAVGLATGGNPGAA
jgi:hypothetical protein